MDSSGLEILLLPGSLMNGLFFHKDKHKTDLFAKWGALYHCWTQVKWGLCTSGCKKCMYLSLCFPVGGHSFLLWLDFVYLFYPDLVLMSIPAQATQVKRFCFLCHSCWFPKKIVKRHSYNVDVIIT